ncbi:MAG: DUF1295 domain-containing protein [Brevinema sp.]
MDLNYHFLFQYALTSGLVLFIMFTITFIIAQKQDRWVILDGVWGSGFIIVALIGWMFSGFEISPKIIILLLVMAWGVRLSLHLIKRVKKEDPRYQKLKGNPLKAYFIVFLSQGLFTWMMCLPFYFYFTGSRVMFTSLVDVILFALGITVCMWGLFWEWTADAQLKIHIHHHQGELMQTGLWNHSRHPNYFGEICFWWGIWFATQASGSSMKFSSVLLTLISPLTITLIISKLTGPMLEELMKKYPEWEQYKAKTPYIIPKFYKKEDPQ